MLLGIWKNIQELEESICLAELEVILEAAHDSEHRQQKFAAALKGIDLDAQGNNDVTERFDAIKNKVTARNMGVSEDALAFDDLGLDFE